MRIIQIFIVSKEASYKISSGNFQLAGERNDFPEKGRKLPSLFERCWDFTSGERRFFQKAEAAFACVR